MLEARLHKTPSDPTVLDVLIVEDEYLIAFDLEMQVEALGHRVTGMAQDLASCMAAARARLPDVALMDMRLKGGESGEDLARWLLEELQVRCIFVSGNLDDARRKQLRALEAVDFVGKPFLPAQLENALAKVRSGKS